MLVYVIQNVFVNGVHAHDHRDMGLCSCLQTSNLRLQLLTIPPPLPPRAAPHPVWQGLLGRLRPAPGVLTGLATPPIIGDLDGT